MTYRNAPVGRGRRANPAADAPSVDSGAARAWAKFHLRSAANAKARRMPWIKGMAPPAELGLLEGLEVGSRKVNLAPKADGPVLAMDAGLRRLFLLSWKPLRLSNGARVKAVWYFPRSNSGKYDRSRGFRHEFGEGGRRPKADWHLAYPMLRRLAADGRVWELVDGEFTVEDRGIVG